MSCLGTTLNNACANGACFDIDEKNLLDKAPYVCFAGSHCTSALDGALSTREQQGAGVYGSNQFTSGTSYYNNKIVYKHAPFYPFIFAEDKLPVLQSYQDPDFQKTQPAQSGPSKSECKHSVTMTQFAILMLALIFIIRSKK